MTDLRDPWPVRNVPCTIGTGVSWFGMLPDYDENDQRERVCYPLGHMFRWVLRDPLSDQRAEQEEQ